MKAAVTLTDVAKAAGFFIQTVSRILKQTSQAAGQRVPQAIEHRAIAPSISPVAWPPIAPSSSHALVRSRGEHNIGDTISQACNRSIL